MRLLLGLLVVVIGCKTMPEPRAPAPGEANLRVMSWNVNFGITGSEEAARAILEADPDVVLLQETTPAWQRWADEALRARYPHQRFDHCCRAGGLAVLSKTRVREVQIIEAPSGWFPAARVVVESALGPVQLLNVHLHPPVSEGGSFVSGYFTTDGVRHEELSHFLLELGGPWPVADGTVGDEPKARELAGPRPVADGTVGDEPKARELEEELPTLVVGDFNERRGTAVRALEDMGFACALDRFLQRPVTWRWQLPAMRLEQNLDHIFAGPGLEPIDGFVVDAGDSDHLPIVAVLTRARD